MFNERGSTVNCRMQMIGILNNYRYIQIINEKLLKIRWFLPKPVIINKQYAN